MPHVLQTPGEALTWSIDWTEWLASADTIASATWSITPSAGVTVTDLGESNPVSSARVSGLTRGQQYLLTCDMVSTLGETGQQSISIRCDHR
jgi:hypothetical protein